MSFTVIWTPTAHDELATIWMSAVDRNTVTAASHTIDHLLRTGLESYGTIRYDAVRTLMVHPLGVDYEIVAPDRIVYVLTVWDITKIVTNGSVT